MILKVWNWLVSISDGVSGVNTMAISVAIQSIAILEMSMAFPIY